MHPAKVSDTFAEWTKDKMEDLLVDYSAATEKEQPFELLDVYKYAKRTNR